LGKQQAAARVGFLHITFIHEGVEAMPRNPGYNRVLFCAVLLVFASTDSSWGQSTATLEGTVTDATGAVVPNAKIVVHNQATGEERNVESDSAGVYVVPSLPVGTYRVNVAAPGMQSMVANNIPLEVGRTVQQNFTLRVASSSEVVEVTGVASVVTSETVTVGSVIDQKTLQEIPVRSQNWNRNSMELCTTSPPCIA
jgi:hypothetical protein